MMLSRYAEEDIAMAKVWLITGSGNGLGRDIAEAALAAGDNVVAGPSRNSRRATSLRSVVWLTLAACVPIVSLGKSNIVSSS
jgi:NAD(P)-dependent dehydrogenase (short-subunit alcohol dehydrogenase family)